MILRAARVMLVLLVAACDVETSKAQPATLSGPPALGSVRVENLSGGVSSLDPSTKQYVRVMLEYAGPKDQLEIGVECWQKGALVFGPDWRGKALALPQRGEVLIGIGNKAATNGTMGLYIDRIYPQGSGRSEHPTRVSVGSYHSGPLLAESRSWTSQYLPGPLTVGDDQEIIIGGALPEVPGGYGVVPLSEFPKHADQAWLFKVRLSKKSPSEQK